MDQPASSASTSRRTRAGSLASGGPAGSAGPSREPGRSGSAAANNAVQSSDASPATANSSTVRFRAVSVSRLRTRVSATWSRPTAPDLRSPWARTSRSSPGAVMSNQPGRTIVYGSRMPGPAARTELPVHQVLVGTGVGAGDVDRGHQGDPRTSIAEGTQHPGDAAVVDALVRAAGRPVREDHRVDVVNG